uniref:Uncharacterized protein n=1 Tax=Siphoviridae sp. ctS1E53 TaxID=2826340 RepID=A0A8S5MEQ6_9CAUD|nr:MAG TPA: hypothetical protein [Siphoviridae sp. ctS1E53]
MQLKDKDKYNIMIIANRIAHGKGSWLRPAPFLRGRRFKERRLPPARDDGEWLPPCFAPWRGGAVFQEVKAWRSGV